MSGKSAKIFAQALISYKSATGLVWAITMHFSVEPGRILSGHHRLKRKYIPAPSARGLKIKIQGLYSKRVGQSPAKTPGY